MSTVEQIRGLFRRQKAGTETQGLSGAVSHIPDEELSKLLQLRHSDPHSILGAHVTSEGVIFRTFRPDAERVLLLVEGEPPYRMVERPQAGLFEVLIKDRHDVPEYRLEVRHPGAYVVTIRSPYSFPPTLGDLDLHLWRQHK